ncbi:MAG: type 1 glutamine amidotransferase [Legionellales bacterium]|nr:type 1 glutamine amidotransferase [Legionellales bacterium]
MRKIGITLRVEEKVSYKERRDCIDQRWYGLIDKLNGFPVLLANINPSMIELLFKEINLDAIILTGGNSIASLAEDEKDIAPERDSFEVALLTYAIKHDIPVVGICRGMQLINTYFGGSLTRIVRGHINTRHAVNVTPEFSDLVSNVVNSYHGWGISSQDLGKRLEVFSHDDDGYIEGFYHRHHKVAGIMWHPEREEPVNDYDCKLLKKFLL